VLHSLLVESEPFSASYGGGNANHLAMALVALDRLGASDERLREFASIYERQLRLKPSAAPALPNGGWKEAMGKKAFETTLAKKFAIDLAAKGRDALLHEVVSHVTPGIASEAFHGLIRTAYAVDSGDDADIANALTSWVIGYGAVGRLDEPRFDSAIDAFAAMSGDDRFPKSLPGGSITGRIAKIVAIPAFDEYRAPIRALALGDLARIAALMFLATGDFTVLHLVTACHATRVLKPYLAADAVDHLMIAMLAAYASVGRPDFDVTVQHPQELPDWSTLAARAIPSNDEHDLKLVYSCQQEEQHYGWGLHQMAAARRLDR
jgi:hypothetical protein